MTTLGHSGCMLVRCMRNTPQRTRSSQHTATDTSTHTHTHVSCLICTTFHRAHNSPHSVRLCVSSRVVAVPSREHAAHVRTTVPYVIGGCLKWNGVLLCAMYCVVVDVVGLYGAMVKSTEITWHRNPSKRNWWVRFTRDRKRERERDREKVSF